MFDISPGFLAATNLDLSQLVEALSTLVTNDKMGVNDKMGANTLTGVCSGAILTTRTVSMELASSKTAIDGSRANPR